MKEKGKLERKRKMEWKYDVNSSRKYIVVKRVEKVKENKNIGKKRTKRTYIRKVKADKWKAEKAIRKSVGMGMERGKMQVESERDKYKWENQRNLEEVKR